ncbi:MAG: hypothetical protein OXU45_09035 [Candidatus Melainabacteria bacterium]|nr:hypothetical protein [Candidatus Melainabacteria bacterium]
MTDILFASETELNPELRLSQSEIAHRSYSMTQAIKFSRVLEVLKHSSINIVLINAHERKLEAYELAREIKENFRGAIKTFVYLPNSSANEGSRFGLVNAEVEDEQSIKTIADKLCPKKDRDYILEENITSFYSLSGGAGSSFIAILLSYALEQEKVLLLESNNNFSIRDSLQIPTQLALLSRDRSKEINQVRDLDWFMSYVSKAKRFTNLHYLNLFANIKQRNQYLSQAAKFSTELSNKLEELAEAKLDLFAAQEFRSKLLNIANSLQLLNRELEGESFSLFDELVQLGSKLSKIMFFDLSQDILSPLNKQLLKFSKNIVVVFRDGQSMKQEYLEHKAYLENYNLNIIPVLAPAYYHYQNYQKLSAQEWISILGEVPVIYPYCPDQVTSFLIEGEQLAKSSPLMNFAQELLSRLAISARPSMSRPSSGLLKLLVGANA